uniref:Uncharacterized protein n=1 Tax=Anguilla anguilla TaxID=7936 RepID=A0A0E9PPT9_ANGAN
MTYRLHVQLLTAAILQSHVDSTGALLCLPACVFILKPRTGLLMIFHALHSYVMVLH